ncbi:MAG: hypothetical protein EBX19_08565 [Actinobacteria bacterium]|nr:hypothetical protein [Actinomycetota bacterium]
MEGNPCGRSRTIEGDLLTGTECGGRSGGDDCAHTVHGHRTCGECGGDDIAVKITKLAVTGCCGVPSEGRIALNIEHKVEQNSLSREVGGRKIKPSDADLSVDVVDQEVVGNGGVESAVADIGKGLGIVIEGQRDGSEVRGIADGDRHGDYIPGTGDGTVAYGDGSIDLY